MEQGHHCQDSPRGTQPVHRSLLTSSCWHTLGSSHIQGEGQKGQPCVPPALWVRPALAEVLVGSPSFSLEMCCPARLDGAGMGHSPRQDKVPGDSSPLPPGTVAGGCARVERVEEAVWDTAGPVGGRAMAGSETGSPQDPFQPKLFHESTTAGRSPRSCGSMP